MSQHNESAEGVQSLFSRVGEFFHIFDLSFLVSGATTLGALLFLRYRLRFTADPSLSGWLLGCALIVASYVCGLLSFAVGRLLNTKMYRRAKLHIYLDSALRHQGLKGPLIDAYRQSEKDRSWLLWRLYTRLWQQLAAKHPKSVAFHHLSRYWAMAATYDGVAVSLLIWAVALAPVSFLGDSFLPLGLAISAMIVLVASAFLCLWQGSKYFEFQIEDLVAALAALGPSVE